MSISWFRKKIFLFLNILVFLQNVDRWHPYSDIFFECVRYSKYLNNHNLVFNFFFLLSFMYLWHLGQYHFWLPFLYNPYFCNLWPHFWQYLLPFLTPEWHVKCNTWIIGEVLKKCQQKIISTMWIFFCL